MPGRAGGRDAEEEAQDAGAAEAEGAAEVALSVSDSRESNPQDAVAEDEAEAQAADELPERVLGCARIARVDLDGEVPFYGGE